MSKIYDGDEPYIFVSYSHKDKQYVESVIQLLQRQACNIWYDPGITPGESWNDDIAKHLRKSQCVLVFISDNSINSEYVLDEIYYAKKGKIKMIPCYIEGIPLPDEVDLSIGRIQAINCFAKNVGEAVYEIKKLLPEEVFHKTTSPFYSGENNMFYLERTSVPFPEGSYFEGENLESFELYCKNQIDPKRKLLWRYQFMPALELDTLSVSFVHKFEDPYFDLAITDVVLLNLIIGVSGRYPTPYPCVDIVLTIAIINLDTETPKIIMVNGQAFNQDGSEKDWDISFSERLVKSIISSVEDKKDDSGEKGDCIFETKTIYQL